ncbi:head GIN domain-containing protein [Mucilaginibacter sp.]|uniref:head GIN domain-containing protein n=1 Tax=Mucilaginibacter sp. TaxID=1882438 RepID=UPI0025F6A047|nr:head GIN domain-containing protein [Mucilaginibacter sp.]
MKKIKLLFALAIAGITLGGLASCRLGCVHGSGHQQSESRKVDGFEKITISGGFKVILKQDSTLDIKITADDNLLKYIRTTVSGDRLKISTKRNLCNTGQMTVYVGIKRLNELKASGAVEVESDGKITTQDIEFNLSSATKLTLDLNAANVRTTGSGVTTINLKGQATSHDVEMAGSGKLHAFDFVVSNCSISSSGVGHSEVNVLNKLNVHSSGASDVKYKGNPAVNNDKSGASSVEKAD